MLIEVKVPELSESVAEATLLAWHKKVGEPVKRDENLIDIETDKVVLELPAPADGVLAKIIRADGGTVKAGEIIATIDTEGKVAVASAPAPVQTKPAPAPTAAAKPALAPAPAMPAARKIAEEKGIDTGMMAGSGRGGRVTKGDVLEQAAKASAAPVSPGAVSAKPSLPQPPAPVNVDQILSGRPEQRVPMSRLRARIAERLVQSQSTAAILTTFNEVNMQPVVDLRKKYQERFEKEHGVRLGFMSFFVKAAVHALKKYPIVNASIDGNDIVYHGYFDIGVAVSSSRGLVVIRPINYLALSYDHRIVDGREAVLSLVAIKEALEDPARLLLDL